MPGGRCARCACGGGAGRAQACVRVRLRLAGVRSCLGWRVPACVELLWWSGCMHVWSCCGLGACMAACLPCMCVHGAAGVQCWLKGQCAGTSACADVHLSSRFGWRGGITPTQSAVAGEPWLLLSRIDPSVSRSTSQSQLPQRRRTTNWWADASLRLHPNSSSKRESGEGGYEHYQVRLMARCHCEIK